MEFGTVGLEGSASSSCGFASLSSIDHGKQKCCVSAGFLKQDTPGIVNHDDDGFRASKIAKVRDDLSASKVASFVFSDDGQQEHNLLSFSSPKMEDFSLKCTADLDSKNLQKPAFPSYFQRPSSAHSKISGYSCTGGVNASMYSVNGVKGPFTPAQWIELEHQALIYKYIVANEPIPTTLLIPIRRALESAGFFSFPGGLFRPHSFEWGPFHLGFSNSTDPEPGRCRRTDGKKWRCSREAMPDQKYCERHMNRGRHRSRKPVEGQSGHSFSGSTPTTKLTNSSTLMNAVPSSTSATLVVPGAGASDSFSSDHPKSSHVNRLLVDKQNSSQGMQDAIGLNFLSPTIGLHSSSDTFSIAKVHIPFAESNPSGFTVLTSEPLFRPYTPSCDLNTPEPDSQFSARLYTDDFLSSTSSPTGQRVTVSPLRLSGDLGMGLGVGSEWSKKQSNWVPISWETSMGGPLGEALKTTSNSSKSRTTNVSSSLNLLLRGGEGSPQLAALSPTGVLQRTPLGSLSSSSAGSSPRAEYGRAPESTGLGVHTVGSALGS